MLQVVRVLRELMGVEGLTDGVGVVPTGLGLCCGSVPHAEARG